jgi:A/G-specific adenine glycosylase
VTPCPSTKQTKDQNVKAASVGDRQLKSVAWSARTLAKAELHDPSAELPWRRKRTAYRVFLAEFLLIRTRADVVARLFETIFHRYPSIRSLAETREDELAKTLEPLGLRKRVPYLKRAALYIIENHRGRIPRDVNQLMKVPGLGAYSAVAIAAFAHKLPEVPADVNILRFLSRLTGLPMEHTTKGSKDLWSLLPLLSETESGLAPEKLLDFSRLICRPGRPKCEECPVRNGCAYFSTVRGRVSAS